jgi:hypothetical protein
LVLLLAGLVWIGCGDAKSHPVADPPRTSTAPPEPHQDHAPSGADADRTSGAGCTDRPRQTGAGCDSEGIQAVVRAEISADGGVGRCYRTHSPDRRTGRILLRIVLDPDGRAASVDATEDGLGRPALTACLRDLLLTLQYPAPGDVPCTALYPFNFK